MASVFLKTGKSRVAVRVAGFLHRTAGFNPEWVSNGEILAKIVANPSLPQIDDYYEPFDFDYEHLQTPDNAGCPATLKNYRLTHGKD